uniref:Transmembrane protein n=1 Tax=Steinernema glaseri TaxID=37863 RepID=A0A1I7Z7B3_9BILA
MSGFSLLVLPAVFAVLLSGVSADNILETRSNSVCATLICPQSSFAHYYECCGSTNTDCCFKLQTWLIVVVAILLILIAASVVLSLIKCIFCCN